MDEHMWQWATLEMGRKNKISYKCFNEDQNNYNDTTAPCKSILPWVEEFEARSSIKRGTWCKMPSVPPVEVSYEAGVRLKLNKVSVKRGANSSPSLDLSAWTAAQHLRFHAYTTSREKLLSDEDHMAHQKPPGLMLHNTDEDNDYLKNNISYTWKHKQVWLLCVWF